jgi:hypothetical protein
VVTLQDNYQNIPLHTNRENSAFPPKKAYQVDLSGVIFWKKRRLFNSATFSSRLIKSFYLTNTNHFIAVCTATRPFQMVYPALFSSVH